MLGRDFGNVKLYSVSTCIGEEAPLSLFSGVDKAQLMHTLTVRLLLRVFAGYSGI